MESKQQVIIVSLLTLIVGLLLGYLLGANSIPYPGFFSNQSMYEEVGENMYGVEVADMHDNQASHRYGEAIIDGDGELQHMMDEMMLIGRGKTGEAYEEAWLRGMIVHHLGAVRMSEELLEKTDRPELIELGNDIIKNQETEVEQMKEWLEIWFNEN